MSAVLIQHVQNSPEWHAWRKNGIGGSDAPVIEEAIMKNAKAYANANASANTYANANANAYANDYDYANANADANADANATATADAYRTKVADACVETLRLACGIKE
jgi:succinylarginine dihydrolase